MTVVQNLTELRCDELVSQSADVAIESEALDIHMRDTKNRRSGGFVAPTGLDADEAVLDDVDASNAVFTSEGVESEEDLDAVGVGLIACRELAGETGFELESYLLGRVGRGFGGSCQFPHVCGRGSIWVL